MKKILLVTDAWTPLTKRSRVRAKWNSSFSEGARI